MFSDPVILILNTQAHLLAPLSAPYHSHNGIYSFSTNSTFSDIAIEVFTETDQSYNIQHVSFFELKTDLLFESKFLPLPASPHEMISSSQKKSGINIHNLKIIPE